MADLDVTIHSGPGELSVRTFQDAVNHSIGVLREFDAALSGRRQGVLKWYVQALGSNGDLHLSFSAHIKRNLIRDATLVGQRASVPRAFLTGLDAIENHSTAPPYLSEFGMLRTQKLAGLIGANGAQGFRFSSGDRHVEVTPKTSENLSRILPTKREAIGSIEGNLEAINIHRQPKFIVYHAITHRAITCTFEPGELTTVKSYLGNRVLVKGLLYKNVNGETLRAKVDSITSVDLSKRFRRDNIDDLPIPDFADNASTSEYLRRIRG